MNKTHTDQHAAETTSTIPQSFDDWVSFAEAARRLPSPKPGKRTHIGTIVRWVLRHKLTVMKRDRWRFVKWSELRALHREIVSGGPLTVGGPVTPRQPRTNARQLELQRQRAQEWANEVLRRAGVLN